MVETNAYRTVRHLFQAKAKPLGLRILGGANGLDNQITSSRIQKLGLGLAGYTEYLDTGRVQFVGRTETHLLNTLSDAERTEALQRVFKLSIPCVVVAGGSDPPPEMLALAREYAVPLLMSSVSSARAIDEITECWWMSSEWVCCSSGDRESVRASVLSNWSCAAIGWSATISSRFGDRVRST